MKENYKLKEAVLEDLPVIVDIYNSTISSRMVTADTKPVSVGERLAWFHSHNKEKHPLYIIISDEKIAGWLSFQSFYGRPAYDATAEISIYMQADYRGRGLGRWALEKAIEVCPSLGIKTLLGFIFHHNEPSIRLFKKFGFEKWAHLPRVAEIDGIERDLLILGKRIIS
jgi:L-amino acid N-acyltransferase YncA